MSQPQSKPRFRWPAGRPGTFAAAAAVLLLVLGAWWFVTSRPPRPEPELTLTDLVRLDGRLVLRNDTNRVFTGWLTDHYADGTLRSRSRVADGQLHGVSEGWHTNGVLQVREHFVAGVAEGPVLKWHPNGSKLSEGIAQGGKLEGTFHRWHPNGTLAEAITMKAGQPHGLSRAWFPSGHLKAEVRLDHGQVVGQQFWQDGEHPALAAASQGRANPPHSRGTP